MTEAAATEPLNMNQLRDELDALNAAVTKQGAEVRTLKKEGGAADAIEAAVAQLTELKVQAAAKSAILHKDTVQFNRKSFDDLVLRKMFVVPAFEIHGGVKGLYDLGPPACALKVRVSVVVFDVYASEVTYEMLSNTCERRGSSLVEISQVSLSKRYGMTNSSQCVHSLSVLLLSHTYYATITIVTSNRHP